MNTNNGSIHPGLKAMIAGCSFALMSAFVWYSHINAQSNSVLISGSKSKAVSTTVNSEAPAPPPAPQHPAEQQRTILLSGSKSYTGSTIIKAETLKSIQDKTPDNATKLFRSENSEAKPDKPKDVLMSGSKVGVLTTTITPSAPVPGSNPQPPSDQQRGILMMSSKSTVGTIFIKPGTLNEVGIDPEPKAKNAQPQPNQAAGDSPKPDAPKDILMSGPKSMILTTSNPAPVSKDSKNPSQPVQAAEKPQQPDKPKDVLMFGSKAMSQPVFSTRRVETETTQKAAPPAQQQKSEQK